MYNLVEYIYVCENFLSAIWSQIAGTRGTHTSLNVHSTYVYMWFSSSHTSRGLAMIGMWYTCQGCVCVSAALSMSKGKFYQIFLLVSPLSRSCVLTLFCFFFSFSVSLFPSFPLPLHDRNLSPSKIRPTALILLPR